MPFLASVGCSWPLVASMRSEVKKIMPMFTDYGHPERVFFQKFEAFGLGQTNWAEILRGIWAISGQTIHTFLAL